MQKFISECIRLEIPRPKKNHIFWIEIFLISHLAIRFLNKIVDEEFSLLGISSD